MSGQQHAPAVLYPRERPGTHCAEGGVDPRAGTSPERPARSSVAIPTELPGPHHNFDSLLKFSTIKRKEVTSIYNKDTSFCYKIDDMYCAKIQLVVDEGDSIPVSSKTACYDSYQSAVLSSECSITCNHSRE